MKAITSISSLNLRTGIAQETLLRRITNRIRQSLELKDIITVTTDEVRGLLGTDRVMIYQFHQDGSGQVIAESIYDNRLPTLLGLNFPADDIPLEARELFIKSRVRTVVNVDTQEIGQFPLGNWDEEVKAEDIRYRPVNTCHVEYLKAMGVKSSVIAPIIHADQLWGLLVSHHSQSRNVAEYELDAMQMVVEQLSVAIAQSSLLRQAQQKAEREALINNISTLLHSLPTIVLEPALAVVIKAFKAIGGRICIRDKAFDAHHGSFYSLEECLTPGSDRLRVYTSGQQPEIPEETIYPLLEQYNFLAEHYKSGVYDVWGINDIYEHSHLRIVQLAFQPTKIRSLLVIPLHYRQQLVGYLSIFRNEIDVETLWAGEFDPDQRQLYPRSSFATWRESQTSQPQKWSNDDLILAQEIGKQFGLAIQQYELYQNMQDFNTNLVIEVNKRTLEMQKTAAQQEVVFGIINKIRESLDADTIFKTTTQEVCQLVKADRVSVYKFSDDWGGEFVGDFEAASPHWSNQIKLGVKTVWNDTYLQDTQGGRYRHNQTIAVDDIYQMNFTQCHLDNLEAFQIYAFILAPIFVGQKLWGLLCTYQHSGPRSWRKSEVNFITQIAAQLGVVIQQAELLQTTRLQAEELNQALEELKSAQTQLIQTEKMSSLGQMVAGIAHEINNPVNFIYGNITHINEYSQDIFRMLNLYEREYINPKDEILELAEDIELGFVIEDFPKVLASMKMGVERIRQIVLSLRNFSRLDEALMKEVDIHEGIDNTLMILHNRFKANPECSGIEIIKEYGDLPLVECYAGQLNQVFMNVLSNGIDALEHHQSVSPHRIIIQTGISQLSENVQSAMIRIIDNGPGIPEATRAKIFDPFFTTKPVGKGTGLGLSISYQIIVEKHHGVFKCDSQPGLGTEFSIEIPLRTTIN